MLSFLSCILFLLYTFSQEANKSLYNEKERLNNEVTMLKHKLSEMQAVSTSVQQYKTEIDILNQQVRKYKAENYVFLLHKEF